MFWERYIIENIFKMLGRNKSGDYESVPYPFNGNYFQGRVLFQVAAEFGNVHIKIAAVEKIIIAPKKIEDLFSINDLIVVLIK
jgi:hypothetical protein